MKIGILQTGHAPDELLATEGDYDGMFRALLAGEGFEFETFAVVDGIFPESADSADGWLITGSKHGAYEDHPWIPPLETLIREISASGKPLVGVCFGHQIIAQALGGKVEKFAGGWAVGRQTYDVEGKKLAVNAWHQDQVVKLPENTRVIGTNPHCENAVLMIGENILTLQPHPEFGAGVIRGLIEYRGGALPAPLVTQAKDALENATQRGAIRDMMVAHLKRQTTEAAS
ncbi:type 1 glutamine amidotransferase [Lentibacter sp. XHP0401]|jgi:GMP synthase-like glutamine amidotransferase|uniref:type 1 glutamine amidotransferase n=1 Tax=Lentibacter sp. XHP0401 TaxID=2984334 RepID=UPI0021E7CC2A|nr:type 1 glutamine amidotransferase [Lentibacter sp. XHP0401]MCV2891731.1 type 1 glutamine amidotransferase [Lentibacter sp. XHP0401]